MAPHRIGRVPTQWDEISFIDAVIQDRPRSEATLVRRLLDHVSAAGGTFIWSQGASPRVSAWYPIANTRLAVWNLNADIGRAAGLYFYLPELSKRVPRPTLERACHELEQVPALTAKVSAARAATWGTCPMISLADLAALPGNLEAVFQAIQMLVDEPFTGDKEGGSKASRRWAGP